MKTKFLFISLWIATFAMAQTGPLTKAPAQLALEMTEGITNLVTLSPQQQTNLAQTATTYFTAMRSETRSSHDTSANDDSFQMAIEEIMTSEKYADWQDSVLARIERHTEMTSSRLIEPSRGGGYICSGVSVSGSNATVTLCVDDYNPNTVGDDPTSFNVVLPSGQYYRLEGWLSLETVQYLDYLNIREVDANGNTLNTLASLSAFNNSSSISLTSTSTTGRFAFDIYCVYGAINANSGFEFTIRPLTQTPMEQACAAIMGVGTCNPQKTLHVNGELRVSCPQGSPVYLNIRPYSGNVNFQSNSASYHFDNKVISPNGFYSPNNANYNLTLGTGSTARMTILGSNGNVGIGTATPMYKLDVAGEIRSDSIRTQAITVEVPSGADFVFDEHYDLRSLDELKAFIQTNGHLPEIQSAEEMQNNGLNISDFQIQLLQKIEELTLYIIKQEEKIERLKQQVENLSK